MNFNQTLTHNQKKSPKSQQQLIFWDFDDTLANTAESAVSYINAHFRPSLPPKSASDLKDWSFKSILRSITYEQTNTLFESDEFWDSLTLKEDFLNLLNSGTLKHYKNIIITKGTPTNLLKKKEFLIKKLGPDFFNNFFNFIGLSLEESKADTDMAGAIQVDDNIEHLLDTNAHLKILITNLRETQYNNAFGKHNNQLPDNLYIVNDIKDVADILKFNLVERL